MNIDERKQQILKFYDACLIELITSGDVYSSLCPFCGISNALEINPDTGDFTCKNSECNKQGDIKNFQGLFIGEGMEKIYQDAKGFLPEELRLSHEQIEEDQAAQEQEETPEPESIATVTEAVQIKEAIETAEHVSEPQDPGPEIVTATVQEGETKTAASPQLEDGYTRIANEILEALIKAKLNGYEWRIVITVLRKTYGFRKKADWISNSQFVDMTGITKSHVSDAIKRLVSRNILTRDGFKIGFQKVYTKWEHTGKQKFLKKGTIPELRNSQKEKGEKFPKSGKKFHSAGHTKETIQKKKHYVSPKDGETQITGESENQNLPSGEKPLTLEKPNLPQIGGTQTEPPILSPAGEPSSLDLAGTPPPSSGQDTGTEQPGRSAGIGEGQEPGRKPRKTGKPKKQTDPRLPEVFKFFFDTCQELKGFKPEIAGEKDGANVKRALKTMELPEVKECILDFLKSEQPKKLDCTLSVALRTGNRNSFKARKAEPQKDDTPDYKKSEFAMKDNTVIPKYKQPEFAMQENDSLPDWKRKTI